MHGGTLSTVELSPRQPTLTARRARIAVSVLFFTNGALFANLLPRYPEIKADLGLSNAAFGAGVAAYPLGALVAGLSAGLLIRRFRSSRVAIGATLLASLGFIGAGAAPVWIALAGGLFLAGAMDAVTDVAQNSHGLRVQRLYGKSILNSFHAVWSMGAVLGGIMGAGLATLGVSTTWHMVISAVVFSTASILSYRWLLEGPEPQEPALAAPGHDSPDTATRRASTLTRYGVLLALVVIAASGGIVEDAGSSWAAIYLSGSLEATTFVASLGFIALQGLQFVGRLLGDPLVDRFGQRTVARAGGFVVMLGMGSALAVPSVVGSIAGFGLAGLGIATLIPAAMHGADEIPGLAPGMGLTIVSWLLRVGFLVSPPLVGTVADATTLRVGLLLVPLAGLLAVLFAGVLSDDRRAGLLAPARGGTRSRRARTSLPDPARRRAGSL